MKIFYLFFSMIFSLSLIGCATTNTNANTHTTAKKSFNLSENAIKKNPITVAFYTGENKPKKPYIIIGKETVSKYNKVGIKRQEAHIRDAMRHIAATLGGDAVINISNDANTVTGTIIAYKNNKLENKKI